MLYTDIDTLKLYLGIDVADYDDALTNIIQVVCDQIDAYIGYNLEKVTKTERYSTNGSPIIYLKRKPITNVVSITEDDTVYTSADIMNFYEWSMIVCKRKLNAGILNIAVTYEAWYDDVPLDVQSLCHQLCSKLWKSDKTHGWVDIDENDIKTKSMDGLSITYVSGADIAARVKSELLDHKNILSKYKSLVPYSI